MTMLYIVAEGLTEETFIEELLRLPLADHGVTLMGSIVLHGNVRYGRLKNIVVKLLKEHPAAFCTTFIDFYGRGGGFPDDKPAGGTLAALTIGLDRIRASCPLFNAWVARLAQLGEPAV
jgi:hypothetical protein